MRLRVIRKLVIAGAIAAFSMSEAGNLKISMPDDATPRIHYAVSQVEAAFDECALKGALQVSVQGVGGSDKLKPEGFRLSSDGNKIKVIGADQSGLLYGCLELADRIRASKAIPAGLDVTDAPEFKLRGPAIGMQKLGGAYLHPYTPEKFPFFYDKQHWEEYLDFLVSVRMNSLYLWNGHPFASLVKLDDYPEALEVSEDVLAKNREMMYWLTSECDKRGIWLIQMFYNIHLPKGLGIGTSLSQSQPKAADYTRKSIAKFVEEYPNVGLLICLGEALSGKDAQVEWFTETIIPGMIDGLKVRGWSGADLKNADKLPPIVMRGHHIVEHGSHKDVLGEGMKLYPNILSMVKYNGESLTSETPRGKYQQYHKDMSKYSDTHMANVHVLANLEPFRYSDFSFIWNSAKAIRDRLDGNGLHLYPLNYWEWPETPDKADIKQIERDRLWFELWARYSWKLDRDPAAEREYWISKLADTYGTREAAEKVYRAYDAYGECAPRLLRRFGITGGNRQCLSLGMFLGQLTDPQKSHVWQELYDSDSPLGETITQYIANEYAKKPHIGETPPQIIEEVLAFAEEAVKAIDAAASHVTKNHEEFERLRNDIKCVDAMTKSYCAKVNAAMMVHRFRQSNDGEFMRKALPLLEESLVHYKKLAEMTKDAYRYSNGFHGRQRVPTPGVYHWSQMVEHYEKELAGFKIKVANVDKPQTAEGWRANRAAIKPWPAAKIKLLTPGMETYQVKKGAKVFIDRNYALNDVAPQLVGLTGIRFSHQNAKRGGEVKIDFEVSEPVKVLVGYFQENRKLWLHVPMLEHVAHANDRGGIDAVLEDVADIGDSSLDLPKVNVHAFEYGKGKQTLEMIGRGSYIILGVVPANTKLSSTVQVVPAKPVVKPAKVGTAEHLVQMTRKVADWQLKHPHSRSMCDWAQGPFVNGLFAISSLPGNAHYFDEVIKIGEKEKWQVLETIHPANDHCTAQTWLDIYKMLKDPSMIEPTRKALDEYIKVAETLDDELDFKMKNRQKWSWCDALYMSPPAFIKMYRLTGEKKYLDYLHTWWWKVSDYYYDTEEHLYYRDENFFKMRGPAGKKLFWSRGNGWVLGGLVRVLQELPADDPLRPKYEQQLKEMCIKLAAVQRENGLWRGGLLNPDNYSNVETSGSAFFVYGMAYAVNENLIDRKKFVPVIEKAWKALCGYVKADGKMFGIQPVGDKPAKYSPEWTMPYGVGAFLLAGSEVHKLLEEAKAVKYDNEKFTLLSEHNGPVIGPEHPDVKASKNRSGFETGQLIKYKGVYHMFVNEMFGRNHTDLRSSHWTSPDAVNWKRQSTLVESVPGRSHKNMRSEVWLTGVEYNYDDDAWNIFYVAYQGFNEDHSHGGDYYGKIWRAKSKVKGPDGIYGPYEDIEIILQPDETSQKWEGHQAVDSFNPYKAGDKWYAFYGGHYFYDGPNTWPVGLAVADELSGPWKRMPEDFNPVPIVEVFAENPIVSRLLDDRLMAVFDSLGNCEISYSFSSDGLEWKPETRLKIQTGSNVWAGSRDHDMRTPLCAVREDDGTFTVVYTARMKDKPFWAVGKCTIGWAQK